MKPIRTRIVKIGNSRGIRIPKPVLDQVGLSSEVEISMQRDQLVIRPTWRPREGWEDQFRAMAKHRDDNLLDEPVGTEWDSSEWQW